MSITPHDAIMQEIKSRYQQADQIRCQIGPLLFFAGAHKKDREWHVLGAVRQLLIQGGYDAPTHAEESEAPDFVTYTDDGQLWAQIEIVEVLRPDYKRHDTYKQAAAPNAPLFRPVPLPLVDPWAPLRSQIRSKESKRYPRETALIIYYDIGRLSFPDWNTPFDKQLLEENSRLAFLQTAIFDRLLVISSDMRCLVQLHPAPCTIVADEQS